MGASLKAEYNKEESVELNIIFDKVCYYPGEKVNGTLTINPKPDLQNPIFNEINAIIKLVQIQQYTYESGSGQNQHTVTVREKSDIVNKNINFSDFKGTDVLAGINIPFSISIPLDAQPSLFVRSFFIKHFIAIDLPGLKSKRALMIFIKSFQKFSLENKLLKMPAIGLGDFYKKKKSEYMGGRLSCLLKIPKNSYFYFDKISFELYLDCTELNMDLASAKVILNKSVYTNEKKIRTKHFETVFNKDLIVKEYKLDKSLEKYEIKDFLQLSENEFSEKFCPKQIYSKFDNLKSIELDYNFCDIKISPFCLGGLISAEFKIRVEVEYKMKRKKSSFELPIQFYDDHYANILDENKNIHLEDKKDANKSQNILSINDDQIQNNNQEVDDFVIIENEDLEKIYFGKSEK